MNETQQRYIRENAGLKSGRDIAENLDIPYARVYKFMVEQGINNLRGYGSGQKKFQDKINLFQGVSGIYYIKNLTNNRFYIGSSVNVGRRISQHLMKLSLNKHKNLALLADWQNGHEFDFGLILDGENVELINLEQLLIRFNQLGQFIYNKNINHNIELCKSIVSRFHKGYTINNKCWAWNGSPNKDGYGTMTHKNKTYMAHRLSYLIHNNKDPIGLLVCHTCDNRLCVNPEHLFLGTDQTNAIDCSNKGRKGRPSIVDEETKVKMEQMFANGASRKEMAKLLDLKYCTVYEHTK